MERAFEISEIDQEAGISELVRLAQAGDDIVLTRDGQPAVRLVPIETPPEVNWDEVRARRRRVLDEVIAAARARGPYTGPSAAHAADFLYDENGLPT